jgi:hypothetical protein
MLVIDEAGRWESIRLHEYARVYAIPGLYEEVVQKRLRCQSPEQIASLLVRAAAEDGVSPSDLRVLDLAAGNGVSGACLREAGIELLVGLDREEAARAAAARDRGQLYADYRVGDIATEQIVPALVAGYDLNALVCVGALGRTHIPVEVFDRAQQAFPVGAWLAATYFDDEPEVSAYFERQEAAGRLQVVADEHFQQRLTMSGTPLFNTAIIARIVSADDETLT